MTLKTELMAEKPRANRTVNLSDALLAITVDQYPHINGIGPLWQASLVSPVTSKKLQASGRTRDEAMMIVLNFLVREAHYNNWDIHGVTKCE